MGENPNVSHRRPVANLKKSRVIVREIHQKRRYDALDRLSNASNTATAFGWSYDADGNRLSQTGTNATAFNINTANSQLTSTTGALSHTYDYNAAGMVITNGSNTFAYNNRGRMMSTTAGSTNYLYNALGQLMKKSGSGGTTLYVYDESGHLLGEYDGTGNLMQETIWLGDIPVATLQFGTSALKTYYVHTDHLNTPRRITNRNTGAIVWRWDSDPFGNGAATQNPQGSVTVTYNLRFPGQIYLSETGLNYNYFRDYDPQMGRYLESDPIGLAAGINTYAYVSNDPVGAADPRGLVMWRGTYYSWSIGYKGAGAEHWIFTLFSDCVNNQKWFIKVSASAVGPGLGLPYTNSGSTVEFDDHSATPSPSAFNGVFKFAAAGFAAPIGYGWTEFIAGSATARLSGAVEAGFDFSLSSGVGQSSVTSKAGPFCCTQ